MHPTFRKVLGIFGAIGKPVENSQFILQILYLYLYLDISPKVEHLAYPTPHCLLLQTILRRAVCKTHSCRIPLSDHRVHIFSQLCSGNSKTAVRSPTILDL